MLTFSKAISTGKTAQEALVESKKKEEAEEAAARKAEAEAAEKAATYTCLLYTSPSPRDRG